ncbi:MAG: NAD-dependent DNA ligase LigA [Clostridiales bacterium]|nr:NAD-dependent DNA ligase LigA [Clostridiales bacterium]
MDRANKTDRIKELIKLLNKASYAYYTLSREIMSDREYDALYDELVSLEAETGVVLASSPTQNVGYTVLENLKKVTHESRMLSLDKTKEISALSAFLGNREGLLSWKLDGLTIVLTYKNGELERAVTRGNGTVGEDITHNAVTFKNIPLKIDFKETLVLRGEAVIKFKDFEAINENLSPEEKYKNPRNLCSGTVRQLNSRICAERNVNCIIFTLVSAGGKAFETKTEGIDFLKSQGFEFVEYKRVTAADVEKAVSEFEKEIETAPFASDGLVLTFNDVKYSESLGATAKFPKHSLAFKWADELAKTTLKKIIWNTSRTGLINPIAVFEPVELEGTTVERASLHNLSIVENLELGIGDEITVYKANMIIPQIAENLTKSGGAKPPETCPVCGFETEIVSLRDGKALKCPNPNCRAQIVESLSHFCSRDAFNIEGMSDETIKKFVDRGFIEVYPDIFTLGKYETEITSMEGFGEKSFSNMVKAIEKSKEIHLPNMIFALGIENIGLSNARLLCQKYGFDIEKIKKARFDDLKETNGFGEVIAKSITKYFGSPENTALLDRLLGYVKIIKEETASAVQIFEGMGFVITGDVYRYKNRKEVQKEIEARGGKVTGSVSSKTSYLINNDLTSASAKNKKAKALNIPIISEEDFINMLN